MATLEFAVANTLTVTANANIGTPVIIKPISFNIREAKAYNIIRNEKIIRFEKNPTAANLFSIYPLIIKHLH